MKNILVHRIPGNNDNVIRTPELKAFVPSANKELKVGISNPPFAFATNGGINGKTISAKSGEEIELGFLAENTDQIDKIDLYINFDKLCQINSYMPNYKLKLDEQGLHTVNAEYTSNSGYKCVCQLNIKIE